MGPDYFNRQHITQSIFFVYYSFTSFINETTIHMIFRKRIAVNRGMSRGKVEPWCVVNTIQYKLTNNALHNKPLKAHTLTLWVSALTYECGINDGTDFVLRVPVSPSAKLKFPTPSTKHTFRSSTTPSTMFPYFKWKSMQTFVNPLLHIHSPKRLYTVILLYRSPITAEFCILDCISQAADNTMVEGPCVNAIILGIFSANNTQWLIRL